jgi:hypothetical protein
MGAQTKPASSRSAGQFDAWHRWGPARRAVVSGLLLAHLLAIQVGPRSPSILSDVMRQFYRPYLDAAYLDHGYKFFAPEPGPSHLIRYELEFADGSRLEGRLPDRARHWPRLLYHRHFMLSEFMPQFGDQVWDPRLPWQEQLFSPAQQTYIRSYASHLLEEHDARRVTLYLVQHRVPDPAEVLGGLALDDPSLYRTRPMGSFERQRR